MRARANASAERHHQCSTARMELASKLREWGIVGPANFSLALDSDAAYVYMVRLFNYSNAVEMIDHFTDENMRILEILNGPHGYALLKAMEANKETT